MKTQTEEKLWANRSEKYIDRRGDNNRSHRYDKCPYDTTSLDESSYDTRPYDEPHTNAETATNKDRRNPSIKEGSDISSIFADALELAKLEMTEITERTTALSDYH